MCRPRCCDIAGLEARDNILGGSTYEPCLLCKRARAAGWLVVFVPTAVIIHHGGQSEGKVRGGLLTLSGTLSELRYFTKHRRVAELFLLKCLILVEFLLKLLLTKRNDPRRWAYREVLESVLGLRLAQITKEDLCRR